MLREDIWLIIRVEINIAYTVIYTILYICKEIFDLTSKVLDFSNILLLITNLFKIDI